MIPDRLPDALRELIVRSRRALQFEVGVQTFNEQVANRIKRRQDFQKLAENFRFLREETGVHIHADLIVGLPGESVESFAEGFDRLVGLGPQEIQVGMLKRLRGTPIVRHDAEWGMIYSPQPPYEILQNKLINFATMQRLRRFARYWDLVANSGNFVETTSLNWRNQKSPFAGFMAWSQWLYSKVGRSHSIGLAHLAERVFEYTTDVLRQDPRMVADALARDYLRPGRSDLPQFLRAYLTVPPPRLSAGPEVSTPKRQARHLAAATG